MSSVTVAGRAGAARPGTRAARAHRIGRTRRAGAGRPGPRRADARAPRDPAPLADDARHGLERLPGRALARRAVPELRARVDDADQVASAVDARRPAAHRRPHPVQRWLDAREAGDGELAAVYRPRFRPAFVPAFQAWIAERPFTRPNSVPSPLYMPEYRLAETARASALDARADELYREGTVAKTNDDRYVLSTLFFAAVLFFAGISLRLDWRPLRLGVLGAAAVLLLTGVIYVLTLPVA